MKLGGSLSWMMNAICVALSLFITAGSGADESTVITDCVTEPKFPPEKTQIVKVGPFQKCTTERNLFRNVSFFSQTPNYTIMYINSPGADQGITYGNELLCRWHVKCPDNQLLYFDITQHSIEPKINSNLFAKPVCVDYLKLYRDFGTEVSCGFKEPLSDMEPNKLLVEFRSNMKLRFPGFSMRLVCFDPNLQGEGGCFNSGSSTRSKRAGTSDEQQSMENSVPVKSMNNRSVQRDGAALQQTVLSNSHLRFQFESLEILDANGVTKTFNGIQYLVTYNEINGVNFLLASNVTVTLRGFGVLTVVNDTAYYTKFGIDPKFTPTKEEKDTIRFFLQEYESIFKSNNTAAVENGSGEHPRRNRAISLSNTMSTNGVTSSLNSCNAVLKSVAQSYFKLLS